MELGLVLTLCGLGAAFWLPAIIIGLDCIWNYWVHTDPCMYRNFYFYVLIIISLMKGQKMLQYQILK